MKKLALPLSLLALGALGLVACGGGDDDEATAASGSETARDERAVDKKSCGTDGRWGLAVIGGDISCRVALRVMHDYAHRRLSGSWRCSGPDGNVECTKKPWAPSRTVIRARFSREPTTVEADPANTNPLFARHTVTEEGVRFSLRVPTVGWERFSSISTDKSAGGPISINISTTGPQGAEAIIFWTSFPDGDYADPCAHILSPPVGSTAAELAAAVSTAPGTRLLTGPSNVTVDGRPAKHVALTVREKVGCDPGFFYTWRDVYGGALWPKTRVGDTIRVWIVDVHGMRLFIEAETSRGFSRDLEQEVQQILESIRFE